MLASSSVTRTLYRLALGLLELADMDPGAEIGKIGSSRMRRSSGLRPYVDIADYRVHPLEACSERYPQQVGQTVHVQFEHQTCAVDLYGP